MCVEERGKGEGGMMEGVLLQGGEGRVKKWPQDLQDLVRSTLLDSKPAIKAF
jgi:hypothetical protein